MAGTSVYDAIVKFVGDYGELKTGLPNAANAAAAAAGTSSGGIFGGKFGGVLKTTMGSLAGAGLGLLLNGVTQGAVELDAATKKYQADTGATMEQTKLAGDQIDHLFRSNVDSYSVIGDVLSKLATDLHITGDAAQGAAQQFLDYAHATGQEPVAATDSLTQAIKAWRVPADQIPGLMDQIVKGHELYGGSIESNVAVLAKLAPAMQTAGMGIGDATGFLNMFSAAGLDAGKATRAFQTALTKVHSPEEMAAMITQIQSTPNDFERGKLAVALFGSMAGQQMADALKPGTKALGDYTVTTQQAAGATTDAANAVESGFGEQAIKIFHNFMGAIAEVASGFGPIVTALVLVGPKIVPLITAAFGGLAAKLIPSAAAAGIETGAAMGTAAAGAELGAEGAEVVAGQAGIGAAASGPAAIAGAIIGKAMSLAIAAAPFLAVAAIGAGIALAFKAVVLDPGLQQQTQDIGKSVAGEIVSGTLDQLTTSKAALEKGIADIKALPFGDFLYGDQLGALQTQLDKVNSTIAAKAAGIAPAVADAVTAGAPTVEVAIKDLVATFGTSLSGVVAAAKHTGADGMLAMAAGVAAARKAPLDAFNTLLTMLKNQLTPIAEFARLKGELASKQLAAGLKSGDPAVRAQALAVRDAIYARLGELAAAGGPAGKKAMDLLDAGIRSKVPEVSAAAQAAKDAAVAQLNAAAGPAATAGANAGAAFAAAIRARGAAAVAGVAALANIPGMGGVFPTHAAGSWDIPANELAFIHRGEMVVPAATAGLIRSGEASLSGGGAAKSRSGATVNVTVNNPKPEAASTSTKRQLQLLAAFGVLA